MIFRFKDKTGRDYSGTCELDSILKSEDEFSYDDQSLHEWAKEAEDGDVWDSPSTIYEAIEV